MLYRLIYSSEAVPGFGEKELRQLLLRCRKKNSENGITGALIFVDHVFLQILEGNKTDVITLMDKVRNDPRHRNIKVFSEREDDKYLFSAWSMANLSPDLESLSSWAGIEGATSIGVIASSIDKDPQRVPTLVVRILKELAEPSRRDQ